MTANAVTKVAPLSLVYSVSTHNVMNGPRCRSKMPNSLFQNHIGMGSQTRPKISFQRSRDIVCSNARFAADCVVVQLIVVDVEERLSMEDVVAHPWLTEQ